MAKNSNQNQTTQSGQKTKLTKDVIAHDYTVSRCYFMELYCEPERWEKLLSQASKYAYICHDKDVKDDGTPKTKHYHLLVYFESKRKWTAVKKMINLDGTDDTTILGEVPYSTAKKCFPYLIHRNNPEKFQYPITEVVSNSLEWWSNGEKGASETELNLLEDLLKGEKTYVEMAQDYGRDYMLNFRRYQDFANNAHKEMAKAKREKEISEFLQQCVEDSTITLEDNYALADIVPHLIYAMAKCRVGYNSNPEENIRLVIRYLLNDVFKLAQDMGDML